MGKAEGYPRIYLGSCVRNAHGRDPTKAWILPEYLSSIERLEYPRENITLSFLVNDCEDDSMDLLLKFRDKNIGSYRKIILNEVNFQVIHYRRSGPRVGYEHIAMVRNLWLESLSDEDYIFSVDTDIIILPDTLSVLLSHSVDMCSALISNLHGDWKCCNILEDFTVRSPIHNPSDPHIVREVTASRHISEIPEDGMLPVDVTGACILIDRKVIDAGIRYSFDPQGEDCSFCRDARKAGFNLYCDVGHRLFHVMTEDMLQGLVEWKELHNLK